MLFCTENQGSVHDDVERARFEFLNENYGSVRLFCWACLGIAQEELMHKPSSG